jgi:alpha-mannosidase
MTILHIVSHTHWDREWYRTFEEFRFRLVSVVDQVLHLLESAPDYRHFTLDGQTIVLDDYLAIRPEQQPRIGRLIQAGRLLVGPWYILPDEFLEGPEAMLRNLLLGREGCRRYTAVPQPMEAIAYLPDSFGHIAQLPQIAAGFGMEAICLWRGVGSSAPAEFRWAAPDGTQRLVLYLRNSYSNGAWLGAGEEGFVRDLGAERDSLLPHATTPHLLVMHGTDHMPPRPDTPERLAASQAALGGTVVHSTLPGFLAAVTAGLGAEGLAALPLLCGELRSPERIHLLPAVLSARIWIKQHNARCESLLTRWAEPFGALAELTCGLPSQRGFLRQAWTWLLQNHPHDSICGCSIDQVHREMRTRYDWSEQIAEQVALASLEAIAGQIDTQAGSLGSRVVVFNPTPHVRTDRVQVRLPAAPGGYCAVLDAHGRAVPHRVLRRCTREHMNELMDRDRFAALLARIASGAGPNAGQFAFKSIGVRAEGSAAFVEVVVDPRPGALPDTVSGDALLAIQDALADDRIRTFHMHVVEEEGLDVELLATGVPGMGYALYTAAEAQGAVLPPAPLSLPAAALAIENEFFAVEAEAVDGTLTIVDRANGILLRSANRFVDGGDRGDEYTYCPPEHDVVVDRPSSPPSIVRSDDGIGQSLEISMVYRVPRALAAGDRSSRSGELVDLPIVCRVTLTPGVRRIDLEVTVLNEARDHRLRVHWPTPIKTDRSWAEGHFDVVERPVALPTGTEGWAEQPVGAHPQLTFAGVGDGRRGVMLVNQGLPEYEVLPAASEADGVTLCLTLLRCVGWLSRGDLHCRSGHAGPALETPDAQCPGSHTFRYAIVPHAGNYLTAARQAHAFNAPLRAVCTQAHPGALPSTCSFLEVAPAAVLLSAVKLPERGEGLVIRVYNSAAVPVQGRIRLWRPFREAAQVRMDEEASAGPVVREADTFALSLRAKEIATVLFRFEGS